MAQHHHLSIADVEAAGLTLAIAAERPHRQYDANGTVKAGLVMDDHTYRVLREIQALLPGYDLKGIARNLAIVGMARIGHCSLPELLDDAAFSDDLWQVQEFQRELSAVTAPRRDIL